MTEPGFYRQPHPATGPVGYQPVWQGGKEVGHGTRECASRYEAIRDYIKASDAPRGFRVLDLGAYNGYFCRRLHEDFGAQCVAVDSCRELVPSPGVEVVNRQLSPQDVKRLGRFDVTLCLSVLHHHANWGQYLSALLVSADLVFIETAHPGERLGEFSEYAQGAHREMSRLGRVIAQTPTMHQERLRPLWVVNMRDMTGSQEQCDIMAEALKAVLDPASPHLQEAAKGVLMALASHSWHLTYDPLETARRLAEVVSASSVSSPGPGPFNPERIG